MQSGSGGHTLTVAEWLCCHALQDGDSSSNSSEVEDDSVDDDEDQEDTDAGDEYLIAKVIHLLLQYACMTLLLL